MTGGHVGRTLLRGAAIVLALATALLLIDLGTPSPTRPPIVLALRALTIGALAQLGLYWATTARGWQRVIAAALMLPSALIYAAMTVEAVGRLARGVPLSYAAGLIAALGTVVYAFGYTLLVRHHLTTPAATELSDRRG